MYRMILLILALFVSTTLFSQWYGGGDIGLIFGKGWDPIKKQDRSFTPKSFFINIPYGYQFFEGDSHLLIEGNTLLTYGQGLSIGYKYQNLEILPGIMDYPSFHFKGSPTHWSIYNYITPQITTRVCFGSVYLQLAYSNSLTFISIGLKTNCTTE